MKLGSEKPADWYNARLAHSDHLSLHYTQSPYYFLWAVIADRLRWRAPCSVLEIACGTGQLARNLDDLKLMQSYCGFDFAAKRVAEAKRHSPHLRFETADAFETELFTSFAYDVCLATEFLEHIEGDLVVLQRVRPGAHVIASVPNFPAPAHVRLFTSEQEVEARYAGLFSSFQVDRFVLSEPECLVFLMEGDRI
jgi:2-polyprenyl-3-methyl-5-hydroxy-6-metoxy-1,4-benzoquinol methylase